MIFAYDPFAYHAYHTPKNYSLLIIIASILLFYSYKLYKNKISVIHFTIIEILIGIRLLWIIAWNPSLIYSTDQLGFWILLSLSLTTLLTRQIEPFFDTNLSVNKINFNLKLLFRILWICSIVQALMGLWQWYAFGSIVTPEIKTPMIGTIGSANGYGLFLSLALIALIYDWLGQQKWYYKILLSLFGIIIILTIILNGSRGSIFSLILSLLTFLIIYFYNKNILSKFKRNLKITAFSTLLLLIIGFGIVLYQINPESSFGRILVWRISTPMLVDNPVAGVGYGEVAVEYLNYQVKFFENPDHRDYAYKAANLKQVHNEYLQAFCEGGIIGGILFLMIWFLALYKLFIFLKSDSQKPNIEYFLMWAILTAILIHGMVDSPLHVLPVAFIAYLLIGLIPDTQKVYKINTSSKSIKIMGLILSTVFFIFILYKSISQYPGYYFWQKGVDQVRTNRWKSAISNYQKAEIYLKNKGELQFHLGSAMVLSGNYSRGIYHLKKSLETFNDRNIYLSLAYGYMKLRDYTLAEQYAKKALSMFPDHLAPHQLLGEIYFYQGNFKLSKESLERCIKKKTKIKSESVKQISDESKKLWERFYGRYENLKD